MPAVERQDSLNAFRDGSAGVLLATSVVEVGLDVPEATVIAIMGADRFGLSTLHQLRGRVGRGTAPGICVLVPGPTGGAPARKRLAVLETETDGFRIAEEDLRLRGPGELVGVRQAGSAGPYTLDREEDRRLFEAAHGIAREIVRRGEWRPGDGSYYDGLVDSIHGMTSLPADSV